MTVEVRNESGVDVDVAALMAVAQHALDSLGIRADAELSLMLVDVDRMTELHLDLMGLPGPTDVMSIAMDELDLRAARRAGTTLRVEDEALIGDVVLCPVVAAEQAAAAGHTTADELAMLTTHGLLHALGYDHEEPDEHAEMLGLQAELLASWHTA
jgi:probable rRNA maturation factor